MTDAFADFPSLPGRLGVSARFEGEDLVLELQPRPHTMRHGAVRASVASFLVDAVAGIVADRDPELWMLTSDMSVRVRPQEAPGRVAAVARVVRQGRRSVTSTVECTTETGAPFATGAASFVTLPRREGDPPKPHFTPEGSVLFRGLAELTQPLREEAGIQSVHPEHGVVQVAVTPELRNPAGTLQGAMVALVAEAAAEDLVSTRFGRPAVVVDLDLRYLAQTHEGPVVSRSRLLGDTLDAPVEVQLVDTSVDRVTTLVYARSVPVTW